MGLFIVRNKINQWEADNKPEEDYIRRINASAGLQPDSSPWNLDT